MTVFLVGLGGALGSVARHLLNRFIHQRALSSTFPLGIFLINILGSVTIGAIAGLLASSRMHLAFRTRTFLVVGVLGGFTTFSSFSLDTFTLFHDGQPLAAAWNAFGQVGLSLIGVWAGFRIAGG